MTVAGFSHPPLKHHLRLSSSLEVRDEQWQLETVEIRDCFGVELDQRDDYLNFCSRRMGERIGWAVGLILHDSCIHLPEKNQKKKP